MEHKKALEIAERIVEVLDPYCERVAVAGSIRRKRPVVKDIELVVKPGRKISVDLFNLETELFDKLIRPVDILKERGARVIKNGDRYKQIELIEGINLDLFVVRKPAQWGTIMAIRTGPATFSKWIVTQRRKGGALPSNMAIDRGVLWSMIGNHRIPENIESERDFFEAIKLEWIEPKDREIPTRKLTRMMKR